MAGVDAPFNNRQKFQQLQREDKWLEEHPAEFKGTFTEEYRSEHEKIQHEYVDWRRFVADGHMTSHATGRKYIFLFSLPRFRTTHTQTST